MNSEIDRVRQQFNVFATVKTPTRKKKIYNSPATESSSSISLKNALTEFIQSKRKASVRPLTVQQLEQRIGHFIHSVSVSLVSQVTSAHALVYRDKLLDEGRSHKTNKEYLSAVSQFFKYCRLMQYTNVNPLNDITLAKAKKAKSGSSSARQRWQLNELKHLFSSSLFQNKDVGFQWATRLMLYEGLRPSEACQLRISDIIKH